VYRIGRAVLLATALLVLAAALLVVTRPAARTVSRVIIGSVGGASSAG
jgi:hypothetical protein